MNVENPKAVFAEKNAGTGQFPIYWVLLASVAVAILASFYRYFVVLNYDFLIETPCDAAIKQCYSRDCSNGDCPPNNLSTYSVYKIPANVFSSCADNACSNLCALPNSLCAEVPCSSQTDVACFGTLSIMDNNS